MSTYTWEVESVNIDTGTMEVLYAADGGGQDIVLNVPMPEEGADLATWVDGYAPRSMWSTKPITVEVGATGTGHVDAMVGDAAGGEAPNTIGNWQEEYIRAMIYSVLEEVRESSV
jgi:hypothetical protein